MDELASLVDDRSYMPSIDAAAFPGTPVRSFWSSTSVASDGSFAWYIDFLNGYVYHYENETSGDHSRHTARCVRGGE